MLSVKYVLRWFVVALLALAVSLPTVAAAQTVESDLQQLLDQWREMADVPGAVMALQLPDGELVSVASGSDGDTAITPQDRFHIYSISKMFVAAVMVELADEGAVSLDDPLSQYVPDFPNAENYSLRQLLTHRSGIPDYNDHPDFLSAVVGDLESAWTPAQTLAFAIDQPLLFPPGTDYHYSDSNYVLLVEVIEAVTGQTFAQAVRTRFFDHLHMDNTFIRGFEDIPNGYVEGTAQCDSFPETVIAFVATAYGTECQQGRLATADLPRTALETLGLGADGVVTNAADLIRWSNYLFKDSDLGAMMRPVEPDATYGLGLSLGQSMLGAAYGHAGGGADGEARLWYFPERDITFVAFANGIGSPGLGRLAAQVYVYVDQAGLAN